MSPLAVVAAGPYNLFYSLAVAAAAASMFLAGRRRGWSAPGWGLVVGAWAAAGMIGAMLPHVIFGDAVGYRTMIGALLCSTLAVGFVAAALGRSIPEVLDTTAVAIPLGAAIVRVGCFLAGCCQGIATTLPIGVALHPDDVARHPVQLYESVLEAALALVISRRKGTRFASSLGGMCAIRFVTEFVRDNDKFGGLSLAQWIVLPIGALCLIAVMSRRRAAKPRRVLTSGARRAAIVVPVALTILAVTIGLPALESSVLLLGAGLMIGLFARNIGRTAPAGVAVLVLQMPAVRADSTFPRYSNFFGGGGSAASWDFTHYYSNCDGTSTERWTRHHTAVGSAFEVGARRQNSRTQFFTIRAKGFAGMEQVGQATVFQGTPSDPEAFSRQTYGVSIVGDADWKWVGLSGGLTAGRLWAMYEPTYYSGGTRDPEPIGAVPALAMRIGKRAGMSVEWRLADDAPSWAPAPLFSLALGIGDTAGNRIRAGISEAGVLVAGNKMTATGLEIMPTLIFSVGGDGELERSISGGIMFRKWVTAARRPPAER